MLSWSFQKPVYRVLILVAKNAEMQGFLGELLDTLPNQIVVNIYFLQPNW